MWNVTISWTDHPQATGCVSSWRRGLIQWGTIFINSFCCIIYLFIVSMCVWDGFEIGFSGWIRVLLLLSGLFSLFLSSLYRIHGSRHRSRQMMKINIQHLPLGVIVSKYALGVFASCSFNACRSVHKMPLFGKCNIYGQTKISTKGQTKSLL